MNAVETRRRLYHSYFETASRKYGIPGGLLEAMGRRESQFNPDARGTAGELGIMQFMPGTAADYGLKGPGFDWRRDPAKSIDASGRLMRDLGRHYGGNWDKAIAAYNTGQGNVDRGIIPRSTKSYVDEVKSYWGGATAYADTPEGKAESPPKSLSELNWWNPADWDDMAKAAAGAATPIVIIVVFGVAVTWFGLQGLASD